MVAVAGRTERQGRTGPSRDRNRLWVRSMAYRTAESHYLELKFGGGNIIQIRRRLVIVRLIDGFDATIFNAARPCIFATFIGGPTI